MAQTETLLLVLLGFSLAALLALFVLRFLWSLAIRIGSRRMQRQVPATVAELHTERDQLRAEYALMSQKLGSRLESVKAAMAEHMAEVNRNRNRIQTLVIELNARESTLAQRDKDLAAVRERLTGIEKTLIDAQAKIAAQHLDISHKTSEIAALHKAVRERDAHIATLAPPPDVILAASAAADPADGKSRLKHRIEKLSALSQPLPDTPDSAPADPAIERQLAEAARETDDLHGELTRLDAAWSARIGELEKNGQPKPADPAPQPTRGVANVISLAKRIRTLQKDIAG